MSEKRDHIILLIAAVLWSFKGILYKSIEWPVFTICAFRDLIAFIIYGISRRSFRLHITKNTIIGAFLSLLSTTLFTFANKMTLAANAIMLNYTNTAVVILITWLFLREPIRKRELISALFVLIGVFIFFAGSISGGHILGDLIALISGILVGIITVFDKKITEQPVDYYMISCIMTMLIGLPQIVFSPPTLTAKSVLSVSLLGIFVVGLPGILYAYGIKRVNQVNAAVILTIEPVLNALIVAIFIGEIPPLLSLIGGLIVVTSVSIACIPSKLLVEQCRAD